jgi:hypothetical protein
MDANSFGGNFANLTPEQRQNLLQVMQLGGLDEEGGQLQDQLAQAQALQSAPMVHHVSPLGAAFGGVAGALNSYRGAKEEKSVRARQKEITQQKGDLRALYARALMGNTAVPAELGPAGGLQEAQLLGPTANSPVKTGPAFGSGPFGYTPEGGGY